MRLVTVLLATGALALAALLLLPTAQAFTVVPAGTITTDTTWTPAGSPYYVKGLVTFQGSDANDGVVKLTVQPGTTVLFDSGAGLNIGGTLANQQGALNARGTGDATSILFSSNLTSKARGNWRGIVFQSQAWGNQSFVENATIEWGGSAGANLLLNGAVAAGGPAVKNALLRESSTEDLELNTVPSLVEGVTVRNSTSHGFLVNSGSPAIRSSQTLNHTGANIHGALVAGGSPTFDGVTFGPLNSYGASTTGGTPHFPNSVFTSNTQRPLRMAPDSSIAGATFSGNGIPEVEVLGGTMALDRTLSPLSDSVSSAPIYWSIVGTVVVQGNNGGDALTTLTIDPGLELRFNTTSARLEAGAATSTCTATNGGALVANASGVSPTKFTSSSAVKAKGQWGWLRFNNCASDAVSVLDNIIVEYGGGAGSGEVFYSSANVTLRDSVIRESSSSAVYLDIQSGAAFGSNPLLLNNQLRNNTAYGLFTNSGIPTLVDNQFLFNGQRPLRMHVDSVMSGSVFTTNTIQEIELESQPTLAMTKDRTLNVLTDSVSSAPLYWVFARTVTIQGTDSSEGADGVTILTVPAGREVRFASGAAVALAVGHNTLSTLPGALMAQGTEAEPILFTSNAASKARGQWNGITFNNFASEALSRLENVTIEWAGGNGGVYVTNADVAVKNALIRESSTHGIQVSGGSPTFQNVTSRFNAQYGLFSNAGAGAPILDAVTLANNTQRGARIHADTSLAGTAISGNAIQEVEMVGTMTKDRTLEVVLDAVSLAPLQWVIAGVTVQGTDGPDGVTTFTIEPGREVRFASGASLTAGAASGSPGALVAKGTEAQPILFTSNQVSKTRGFWNGVVFQDTGSDALSGLENITIEFAGGGSIGNLWQTGASVPVKNALLRESSTYGLQLSNSNAVLEGLTIRNDTSYGVYVNTGGAPTIRSSTISNHTAANIYGAYVTGGTPLFEGVTFGPSNVYGAFSAGGAPDFADSVFVSNTQRPLRMHSQSLLSSLTFTSNGIQEIEVVGTPMTKDRAWPDHHDSGTGARLPYVIVDTFTIQGTDGGDLNSTLTILPGAEVRFNSLRGITVGTDLATGPGALVAVGSAAQPILFTSNQVTKTRGFWTHLQFRSFANDAISAIENVTFEFGGSSSGEVWFFNARPLFRNNLVRESNTAGIYIDGTDLARIESTTVNRSATFGVNVNQAGASLALLNSTILQSGNRPLRVNADAYLLGNVVNANAIQEIEVVGSTGVLRDGRWERLTDATNGTLLPYVIGSADVTVRGTDGGVTVLEMMPGIEVRFGSARAMLVGGTTATDVGAISAVGTAAEPIRFTSNQVTKTTGFWNSVQFQLGSAASSILENVTFEYGGSANNVGTVYVNGGSPRFVNSLVQNSRGHGMFVNAGRPTLEDSQILGTVLGATGTGRPLRMLPDTNLVGLVVNGNAVQEVEVASATLARDVTWTRVQNLAAATVPYVILAGDLTIQGVDGADGVATLELLPGVEVALGSTRSLIVGGTTGNPGGLQAVGTDSDPVRITGTTKSTGFWNVLEFRTTTSPTATLLDNVTVEYGGSGTVGMVYFNGGLPTFRNNLVQNARGYGIYVNAARPTIEDTQVLGTVVGASGTGRPLRMLADTNLAGLVVHGNTVQEVEVATAATLAKDATWTRVVNATGATVPYVLLAGDLTLQGVDGADGVATLELLPGVEVRLGSTRSLVVGGASGSPGGLRAVGTAAEPVTISGTTKTTGHWNVLEFRATTGATATLLENVTIEYGGSGSTGMVYFNGGLPAFRDNVVRNARGYGIYVNAARPTIEDTLITGTVIGASGTGRPLRMLPDTFISGIVADANAVQQVEIGATSLAKDATWPRVTNLAGATVPYLMPSSGDFTIQGVDGADSVATLELMPGVEVWFPSTRSLNVGAASGNPGGLRAMGTEAQRVVFSGSAKTTGHWNFLQFLATVSPAATVLENVTVEYGGSGSNGAVYFNGGLPAFRNNLVQNNRGYGIYVGAGRPTIQDTLITGTVLGASGTGLPLRMLPDTFIAGIQANGNLVQRVEIGAASLAKDATWPRVADLAGATVPYILPSSSDFTVQGVDGADGVATLELMPGVEVWFPSTRALNVGAASGNPGGLRAVGTDAERIVFSGSAKSPGHWNFLQFLATTSAAATRLENVTVEYGGSGSNGAVYFNGGLPAFQNNLVQNNRGYGIYVNAARPTIEDTRVLGTSVGASGTGRPVRMLADTNLAGVVVSGNAVQEVEVAGGTLSKDVAWPRVLDLAGATVPYGLGGSLTIQGVDGPDGVAALTLQAGLTLQLRASQVLTVGGTAAQPGALVATGTEAEPVLLTSNGSPKAPGQWNRILFNDGASDAVSRLENVTVEYGGSGGQGLVGLDNASPAFRNATLRSSSNYGAYVVGGRPDLGGLVLTANAGRGLRMLPSTVLGGVQVSGNALPGVEVGGVDLAVDNAWPNLGAGQPYVVAGSFAVFGTDGADGVTALTVAPGAEVQFNSAVSLYVGGSAGQTGALVARGTAAEPILFTTSQTGTKTANYWDRIEFRAGSNDALSAIENATIEGGSYYYYSVVPSVWLNNAAPTFRNNHVRLTQLGVRVDGGPVLFEDNHVEGVHQSLYLYNSDGNTIRRNRFDSTTGFMFADYASDSNLIVDNEFRSNPGYRPVVSDSYTNTWYVPKTPGSSVLGGPYLGGNYYSNYGGNDFNFPCDGLGDNQLPYGIVTYGWSPSGQDLHPLVPLELCTPDIEPPVSAIDFAGTLGNENWFVTDVTVTLEATDALSGVHHSNYSLNQSAYVSYAGPFPLATDGLHTVDFFAVDNVGNVEAPKRGSARIDRNGPALVLEGGQAGGDLCLRLQAVDVLSGIAALTYSVLDPSGAPVTNGTGVVQQGINVTPADPHEVVDLSRCAGLTSDGRYRVVAQAADVAGNAAEVQTGLLVLDLLPPIVEILRPQEGEVYMGTSRLNASGLAVPGTAVVVVDTEVVAEATDAGSGVVRGELLLDGKVAATDDHAPFRWWFGPGERAGRHTLTVRAYDAAGHYAEDTRSVLLVNDLLDRVSAIEPPFASQVGCVAMAAYVRASPTALTDADLNRALSVSQADLAAGILHDEAAQAEEDASPLLRAAGLQSQCDASEVPIHLACGTASAANVTVDLTPRGLPVKVYADGVGQRACADPAGGSSQATVERLDVSAFGRRVVRDAPIGNGSGFVETIVAPLAPDGSNVTVAKVSVAQQEASVAGDCRTYRGALLRVVVMDPLTDYQTQVAEVLVGWVSTVACKMPSAPVSASTPSGAGLLPGVEARDTLTVGTKPGQHQPTGTVSFFLCAPVDVTLAVGCEPPKGMPAGGPVALVGAAAGSATLGGADTLASGKYCWRAAYSGDAYYRAVDHTDFAAECFTVGRVAPVISTNAVPGTPGVVPGTPPADFLVFEPMPGVPPPTGTVTFVLCGPAEVSEAGCEAPKGTPLGAASVDAAGRARSGADAYLEEFGGSALGPDWVAHAHTGNIEVAGGAVTLERSTYFPSLYTQANLQALDGAFHAEVDFQFLNVGSYGTGFGFGPFFGWQEEIEDGGLQFGLGSNPANWHLTGATDLQPHRVAVDFDGASHYKVYLDGLLVLEADDVAPTDASLDWTDLLTGDLVDGAALWLGNQDECCQDSWNDLRVTRVAIHPIDFVEPTRTVGKYCWRAEYEGDSIWLPASHTNADTECFTSVHQPTGGLVTSSPGLASPIPAGSSVTAGVVVTGDGPVPTGTVTFFVCRARDVVPGQGCLSGGTQAGVAALASGAASSPSFSGTVYIGRYCWRADYSGDGYYAPSGITDATSACFRTLNPCADGGGEAFGSSAGSAGSLLLVGAPADAGGRGSACVFNGDTGAFVRKLTLAGASPGDEFGAAVAGLGGDVLVGAPGRGGTGAAYRFRVSDGALLATYANPASSGSDGDRFGAAVAEAGGRALVGAPGDDGKASDAGAAYLFSAGGTLEFTYRKGLGATGDNLGASVAGLLGNALVGAPGDDFFAPDTGVAYLFNASAGGPGEVLRVFVAPQPGEGDRFGASVAGVGSDALVGAPGSDAGGTDAGAAFLLDGANGTLLVGFLNPSPLGGDAFGASVAGLLGNALVGAPGDDSLGPDAGAAYLFHGSLGLLLHTFLDPDPGAGGARMGSSLAAVGDNALAGAPGSDTVFLNAGAAFLFADTTAPPSVTFPGAGASLASDEAYGAALAVLGVNVVVGLPERDVAGRADAGAVHVVDASTGALVRALNLTPAAGDRFGASLAILGDDIVVGAPGNDSTDSDAGVAYLFDGATGEPLVTFRNPSPTFDDFFGSSVAALPGKVVVGAPGADLGAPGSGAVHVFDAATGALLRTIGNPSASFNDAFGAAVAVVGGIVLVGAPGDDGASIDGGAAYLVDPSTGSVLRTLVSPSPGLGDGFGGSVAALGGDALVGAPGDDAGGLNAGAAFRFDGTTGALEQTYRKPRGGVDDRFGSALAAVGQNVLVGAPGDDAGAPSAGAAYLLEGVTGTHIQTFLNPAPAADDAYGRAVAALGLDALVGAPGDDAGALDRGSVYRIDSATGWPTEGY